MSTPPPPLRFAPPPPPSPGRQALRLLRSGPARLIVAALACGSLAAGVAISPRASARHENPIPTLANQHLPAAKDGRPNIVFVLTDDLSMDLLRFMPHVQAMQRQGLTFNDYFVSDSLCCPSRASIFSGNFPHNTGVYGNTGPHGGFKAFYDRGEEQHTFATALKRSGYRTAMMGKYLNGYLESKGTAQDGTTANVAANYTPPGWTHWTGAGYGYPEYNYVLNNDGELQFHGHQPSDYLTDVITRAGANFINRSAQAGRPFFLELATFAPHAPYVPAPQDKHAFPGLKAPHDPAFDRLPTHPVSWLSNHPPLAPAQLALINHVYRRRAQSVQAVDRMIGDIEHVLAADGLANNTYIVFSSDNGFHTGEYRLMPGKLTAFDTDIHVPLVVTGPGVSPDTSTNAMSENIDLAKTFAAIGGTTLSSDGHSLLPLLLGSSSADWRNAILVEHRGPHFGFGDPDYQQPVSGDPWSYEALRTKNFLYVEYKTGEREFYDLRSDPAELHNLAPYLTLGTRQQLHAQLLAMRGCHGGPACWRVMHLSPITIALRAKPLIRPLRFPLQRRHRHRRHH